MNFNQIHSKLLEWYKKDGRHHLPWRNTKDIYHIYLSEIMLQQTQVNRVMEEYYPNFIEKFPTLEDLANAKEEDVLAAWSGLGYYSRARNLHKTAKQVNNNLPNSYKSLLSLPGIGKYTASAICSFGYHQNIVVVDTNIARVIRRFFTIENGNDTIIEKKATLLANNKATRDYNLALMDLGSFVCTPKNPRCIQCPLENYCAGKDTPEKYLKTKKIRTEYLELFLGIWINNNKIALKKSDTKMYKNMLVLPNVEPIEENKIGFFKHAYTKYKIDVNLYTIDSLPEDIIWVDLDDIQNQPVASLTTKAIKSLEE
jgi:A/G-specific adenine glycosylase